MKSRIGALIFSPLLQWRPAWWLLGRTCGAIRDDDVAGAAATAIAFDRYREPRVWRCGFLAGIAGRPEWRMYFRKSPRDLHCRRPRCRAHDGDRAARKHFRRDPGARMLPIEIVRVTISPTPSVAMVT